MTEFTTLLQQGNAWIFIPSAILLGALHGLEPGHSKTMMAAFIVAVRGTVLQAVLLGLAATLSHTAVVWLVAMGGLYFGQHWTAENTEPVFQLISAAIIAGIALWMMWRIAHPHQHDHAHDHDHDHDHDHQHAKPLQLNASVFSPQISPAAPLVLQSKTHNCCSGHGHPHAQPHSHAAATSAPYQDAHERMHAEQIQRQFANRPVTTGQIVLFGLTGGLIPCPASITVLLICLQLKEIALGATLVLCFSIGLALTLVTAGVIASLGMKHMDAAGFSRFTRQIPYFSSGLMLLVAVYMAWHGWHGLTAIA